ncbi:MAG: hypothetical protein WCU88_03460 [Elusimicrobiota bacterium]|jgi:hypothetical protein
MTLRRLALPCLFLLFSAHEAGALEAVMSKYKVQMYGFVKVDAIYDNHEVCSNDLLRYTASAGKNSGDFRMTARSTRVGFDVDAGDGVTAKVEGDFSGYVNTTSAVPRLRHAYLRAELDRWAFIAGQTWRLTSPELPETANNNTFANTGALWSRLPQVRAEYRLTDALTARAALTRPTSRQEDDNGTASSQPNYEGSLEARLGRAVFTLSGAYGRIKNVSADNQSGGVDVVDLGFRAPLIDKVSVNGQLWTGRNLADFQGGVAQVGFGSGTVRANGGFIDVRVQPAESFWFNTAYGIDDPKDDHVPNGGIVRNQTWLLNLNRDLLKKKLVATMDFAYNVTDYKLSGGDNGRDRRSAMHYQASLKLPF